MLTETSFFFEEPDDTLNTCFTKISAALGCDAYEGCLLYTSDAADERSSVDLGGRRIIKKKNNIDIGRYDVTKKKK